jgi:hypothetical protein
MKIIEATQQMKTAFETMLVSADLVNGIGADITNELKPMFWFNFVKSKGASEKQSYLVWRFQKIINNNGDGKSIAYFFDINIKFYSNENDALDVLEVLNNTFDTNGFNMEYVSYDYDNNQQKNYYEFLVKAQVV